MPSDGFLALLIIVIYIVALAIVLGVTLSADRDGRVSRWVVAGGLAVGLGVQPFVAASAADTDITDFTLSGWPSSCLSEPWLGSRGPSPTV